jgi:hypothetical protein
MISLGHTNFEEIQQTIIPEIQSKQFKLPKALKEWPAFIELSKIIADFNTVLPLYTGLKKPFIK